MAKINEQMSTTVGGINAIPAPVTSDNELTDRRVRTVADIQAACLTMWSADQTSTYNRALCQAYIDGQTPYSDAKDRMNSTHGRINTNWGFGRRMIIRELMPYTDVLESIGDQLFTVPTKYGDESSQDFMNPILSEGISTMLRRWPMFNYLWQENALMFIRDGVSFCFHDDDSNWQWSVMGLQQMKFPRRSKPCEGLIDACCCKVDLNTAQLSRYIQNEKIAKENGWNVEAVKEAIKKAHPLTPTIQNDYQQWEAIWKNNDVIYNITAPTCETWYFWIKEYDQTVSHYIINYDGSGEKLFESEGNIQSFAQLMTFFTYGIGTNGDLHSIRGLGNFAFQSGNALERVFSSFMQMAMHASTPHLKCASEDAVQGVPMRRQGPYLLLENGAEFLETKTPPFSDTLVPLYQLTAQIFDAESQGSGAMNPVQAMQRKTNLQEQNDTAREGQLSSSAMNLFFPAMERHFREVVRRISRKGYKKDEPGGEEVHWLYNYLERNGVPVEALYEIDHDLLAINTGIGRGSQMARRAAVNSLMQDYYKLDEEGKSKLLNMRYGAEAGSRIANDLAPLKPGLRPGQDVSKADDENGFLSSKNPVQIASVKIRPDQNAEAHVMGSHIPFLTELWSMTESPDPREPFAVISPVWEHAVSQWEMMDPGAPDAPNPAYMQAKETLQQMGEWVTNTAKQVAKFEKDQQEQAAAQGGAAQSPEAMEQTMANEVHAIDAKVRLEEAVASRVKLDTDVARDNLKLNHEAKMMALKQAEKIAELQNKLVLGRLNIATQTAKLQAAKAA
jgi:hypothetical protein